MVTLDADVEPLVSSKNVKMARDIVQFVPFRDFKDQPLDSLAQAVLDEVPTQFVEYMKKNKIAPNVVKQTNPWDNLQQQSMNPWQKIQNFVPLESEKIQIKLDVKDTFSQNKQPVLSTQPSYYQQPTMNQQQPVLNSQPSYYQQPTMNQNYYQQTNTNQQGSFGSQQGLNSQPSYYQPTSQPSYYSMNNTKQNDQMVSQPSYYQPTQFNQNQVNSSNQIPTVNPYLQHTNSWGVVQQNVQSNQQNNQQTQNPYIQNPYLQNDQNGNPYLK
jgi:hypothetical protein